MRQKRRGDDICTKSRLDNLSSGKKVGGRRGEEGGVKRNAREKVSKMGSGGVGWDSASLRQFLRNTDHSLFVVIFSVHCLKFISF